MANFKKIFNSLDLRNNKIINAKTNTPTQSEHLVNKDYVDTNLKYDTSKANEFGVPFKFNWIPNIYNKSFKEILDYLFFPQVNPVYLNPVLDTINITFSGNYSYIKEEIEKPVLFYNTANNFSLKIKITNNDRLPEDDCYLRILNSDNSEYYTVSSSGSDEENGLTFFDLENFIFIPGLKYFVERLFGPSNETKTDTYGVDYIPDEFLANYLLSVNISNYINQNCLFFESPLISPIRITQEAPTYILSDLDSFSKVTNILLLSDTYGIYDILIPEELINKYTNSARPIPANKRTFIFCNIHERDSNNLIISEKLEYDNLIYFTAEDIITYNGVVYYKYQYNFGVFRNDVIIRLLFGNIGDNLYNY